MKSNELKLKYLIEGSQTERKENWLNGTFEIKKVMRITYTIYDVGSDFIYISTGENQNFSMGLWFDDIDICDTDDGCELKFKSNGRYISTIFLKNIYLEYEPDEDYEDDGWDI